MKSLSNLIKWDLILQTRYQIVPALFVITGLYLLLFWLIPAIRFEELIILVIFSDPALLGLTFIGALILFEKGDNTLDALVVTPMQDWQYLWSKAISLTLVFTLAAIVIAGFSLGWGFHYPLYISTVMLTSILFIFVGIWLVAKTNSMNDYVIKVALALLPISLPLLNLFGITDTLAWYLLPSQASISLLQASFGKILPIWELIYGYSYLLFAIGCFYALARRSYHTYIVQ
ncbi:MAG: hypothetical protein AAFY71_09255 [Bacteroidota bacterium]